MKNYVAPSLLSANKNDLENEIKKAQDAGAEYIHWDIMDGDFVPATNFYGDEVKTYAKTHKLINDVHIMVSSPKSDALKYCDAGADIVTFHLEAVKFCPKCTNKISGLIHEKGVKAGISIKPKTSVKKVLPYLNLFDLVLVMSVEPGKGGQKFMNSALRKIKKLRKYINENNLNCLIEVDGGINEETAKKCRKAGADILVAGSYLYGHDDFKERLGKIR